MKLSAVVPFLLAPLCCASLSSAVTLDSVIKKLSEHCEKITRFEADAKIRYYS